VSWTRERGERAGWIIPIGGAEDKTAGRSILRRFVEVCGGRSATIAVIPTASALSDTGPRYRRIFRDLGARAVEVVTFEERADCERVELLRVIEKVDGVFLTGGNQLRLSTIMGGTSAAELLRRRNEDGLHVAGTSAGAAILSEHMIAYGDEGTVPRQGMVALSQGLGFTHRAIIDQHFQQRGRLGRLLTALAFNPQPAGLGIDEDTAAFIRPDETLEVVGSGAVTVIDASGVEFSSIDRAHPNEAVSILGLRLHILIDGGTYNFLTREATSGHRLARSETP
jgi:cyanophycinase